MEGNKTAAELIDEYISQFPPDIREKLKKLRKVIKEAGTINRRKDRLQDARLRAERAPGIFCRF
jgi:hypothetical protein